MKEREKKDGLDKYKTKCEGKKKKKEEKEEEKKKNMDTIESSVPKFHFAERCA